MFAAREAKKALEAQEMFKDANTKAQQAEKAVRALQLEAQKAQQKAQEEEKKAIDANQEATAARKQSQNAQINAAQANQQAKVAQQNAEQAQKNADDAKREVQAAKNEAETLQKKLALAKKDFEKVNKLSELAKELRNENLTSESDEALRLAGLSFNVKDYKLKQALLLASISQAYQHLKKWDEAEKKIKESNIFLEQADKSINSGEGLQIQVLVNKVQGNLLANKKEINQAIESYQSVFKILNKDQFQTNLFTKPNQLLVPKDIENVYRSLLNLLSTNTPAAQLKEQVEKYLTQHLYAQLEYSLKAKNWQAADIQTDQLMLNIAKIEKDEYLDIDSINNFSCPDLKKIDQLWVNSDKRFGFSVQKEIWINTGNQLGINPKQWTAKDSENYLRFARAVGWYDDKEIRTETTGSRRGDGWLSYKELLERIKDNSSYGRGSLPTVRLDFREVLGDPDWVSYPLTLRLVKCNI